MRQVSAEFVSNSQLILRVVGPLFSNFATLHDPPRGQNAMILGQFIMSIGTATVGGTQMTNGYVVDCRERIEGVQEIPQIRTLFGALTRSGIVVRAFRFVREFS